MMMRRGAPMRRGPGLLGTMARTAVVAGTATAVTGGMQRRRASRQEEQAAAEAYQQQQEQAAMQAQMQQYAQQAAAQQTAPAAPAGGAGPDLAAKIKQLADLNASGALSDEEFTAAKAKLLS
jgi:Short C-terminal domain